MSILDSSTRRVHRSGGGPRALLGRALRMGLADAAVLLGAVMLTLTLASQLGLGRFSTTAAVLLGSSILAVGATGLYSVSRRFVGLHEIVKLATALGAAGVASFGLLALLGTFPDLLTTALVVALATAVSFCGFAATRLSWRVVEMARPKVVVASARPTLLVGAGRAGVQVLESMARPGAPYLPVGFLDDDPSSWGTRIHGVPVLGPISELERAARETKAGLVLICIGDARSALIRDVMARAQAAGQLEVRIIPPLFEIMDGKVTVETTRKVSLEDLLGREAVRVDQENVRRLLGGRRVLVTGGAGTIGSELCLQIARCSPQRLVIVDIDETRLHDIGLELRRIAPAVEIVEALVDVRDRAGLTELFDAQQPHIVFHAAAYKHVPMMEKWPLSGLDVNVAGTANVLDAAEASACERFVLISTDKAVLPSSVMGATKRLAELLVFSGNGRMTRSAVRFGNVIGSRGSVLPTFARQLQEGGPLTVTHPDMERFFMMTSEAVSLVLQAAAMGNRGIYVLDMGKPVRIMEVAREFIRMNGLEPEKDIGISITGLRPGEKLVEHLAYPHERLMPTGHSRIFLVPVQETASMGEILGSVRQLVAAGDHPAGASFLRKHFSSMEITVVPASRAPMGEPQSTAEAQ